ncbi:MAG: HdeD family acid-resistance protein [Alphaproteobacteria bacterium]|nr:HdeD family acid-resistance protein [Alphaproteobacteria bacterium]
MSVTSNSPQPNDGRHNLGEGIRALRAKWGWIVALGVIFMVSGVIALGSVAIATASAVLIVGIMMIVGGVMEVIAAFSVKEWGKFALWMLLGVLYIAAGIICFTDPFAAATILTLFLGVALMVGGIVRGFLAWHVREAGKPWGWVAFSAVITLLLGLMIVAKWPTSSFYTLGIFLGIDLIFIGSGWLTIGLALKKRT